MGSGGGSARIHLDLHVADPVSAAGQLTALGAEVVCDDRGYVEMTSPGGLVFCLVTHPAETRPPPRRWPGGHVSLVDQVCLDIAGSAYAAECEFWAAATGWELRHQAPSEFSNLARPAGLPLRLLMQRLDDEPEAVRAHLDLATDNRVAETARHLALGAQVIGAGRVWTVLRDPAGSSYCLTDRDPGTHLIS